MWNSIHGMLRIYLLLNGITESIYTHDTPKKNIDGRCLEKYFQNTIVKHNSIHTAHQISLDRGGPIADVSRLINFSAINVYEPRPYEIGEIRIPEIEATEEQLSMEELDIRVIIATYTLLIREKKPIYKTDGTLLSY